MSLMDIVSNLSLLYLGLVANFPDDIGEKESEVITRELLALKRAIQILVSMDIKAEMEKENG